MLMIDVVTIHPGKETEEPRDHRCAQWFAVLGAPSAWCVNLTAQYALVPLVCSHNLAWLIHTTPAVFVLVAIAAGLIAMHVRSCASDHSGAAAERLRFMGT